MVENNEIKELITTFKQYRDLIGPIEQNLKEFSVSFDSIKTDIESLNSSFDGDLQTKLDKIYKELALQSEKAKTLATEVDKFISTTSKYVSSVDKLVNLCGVIESKIGTVNSIENKAEQQIEKLDAIIEDKRKNYDVKRLEKNLETYNLGVEKITEYINNDVAENLKTSSERINQIHDKNTSIFEAIMEEKSSIDKLVETYKSSNQLLKQIVENNDVNEQYIFEILDKWAESRKVKTKK